MWEHSVAVRVSASVRPRLTRMSSMCNVEKAVRAAPCRSTPPLILRR